MSFSLCKDETVVPASILLPTVASGSVAVDDPHKQRDADFGDNYYGSR